MELPPAEAAAGASGAGSPSAVVYAGLALTVVCWGLLPVFQKQLLEVFNAVEVTFVRFFLSGLILLAGVLLHQGRAVWGVVRRNPGGVLASSIFGPLLAMVAFNFGIQTVAVGLASLIVALEPVLTYVLAVAVGKEPWNLAHMLSILLCLGGLGTVVAADSGVGGAFWVGLLAVCVTPLVWALNTVIAKGLVEKESPVVLTAVNFVVSSACLLPFLGADFLPRFGGLQTGAWTALALCVLPGTVLGYTIWYWALHFLSPSTLSLSLYAIPVIGVVGGVAFFGESLSVFKGAGVVLVLVGLYLVTSN